MKLQERLRAVESSSDELGGEIGTNSYRNPDGPEAAAQLDLYEAALREARRLCDAVKIDLAAAHAEICKLQKLDPATHSWPEWSSPANTLRWVDDKLIPMFDAALSSTDTGA